MEKEINYNDYNFLTDVQKEIYLKVKDGAKFAHIAREKGVNPEAVRTAFRRAERRVKEYERFHAIKERNLEVIDFYPIFENRASLLPDTIHPNKEGAKVLAEFLADWLVKNKIVKK